MDLHKENIFYKSIYPSTSLLRSYAQDERRGGSLNPLVLNVDIKNPLVLNVDIKNPLVLSVDIKNPLVLNVDIKNPLVLSVAAKQRSRRMTS